MMLLAEAALRSSLLTAAVWLALALLRVRNSYSQMAAWSGVLLASLVMPLLMRWAPAETLPLPAQLYSPIGLPRIVAAATVTTAGQSPAHAALPISWPLLAYLAVALILAARLGNGVIQGLHLKRRSSRVHASWTGGRDIRLSADLAMPAAIGRTILLPIDFLGWELPRRQAVLAHETSHVERGDFYLLLLAALHRVLFWFNPLSWWLSRRLADLAEANSDAAALAAIEDRLSYAQTLIDLAGQSRATPPILAMAAHATVRRRVEWILSQSVLPVRLTLRKAALIAAGLIPATFAAAGLTAATAGNDEALVEQRLADQARPRTAIALDPSALDRFTGYYALPSVPDLPLKVWREGDTLFAGPLGHPGQRILPESDHFFFVEGVPEQDDFQLDGKGRVTGVVLHENGYEWPAARLSQAEGEAVEKAFADRIAANRRQPGSEAALRTHIDQVRQDRIDDATMVKGMGRAIRAMLGQIRPGMVALGPITAVQFDGVGADGMDVYTVTHAKGSRRWRIRLTQGGQIESMWFSPL